MLLPHVITYNADHSERAAQRYAWLGQLAGSSNSKVILMPLEASQVIGAVGGIGEIVKATFGDKQA